jgi:hypothetical protein
MLLLLLLLLLLMLFHRRFTGDSALLLLLLLLLLLMLLLLLLLLLLMLFHRRFTGDSALLLLLLLQQERPQPARVLQLCCAVDDGEAGIKTATRASIKTARDDRLRRRETPPEQCAAPRKRTRQRPAAPQPAMAGAGVAAMVHAKAAEAVAGDNPYMIQRAARMVRNAQAFESIFTDSIEHSI